MERKRRFGLKALIFVAIVSLAAGLAVTLGFDLTGRTSAGNFWTGPGAVTTAKSPSSRPAPASAPLAGRPDFVTLARKLSPTVVNISTTQVIKGRPLMPFPEFKGPFEDFFGEDFNKFFNQPGTELKRQSLGSGFIINKDGYILTNYHVIDNASEIIVTLSHDKKEYEAKVIGQDSKLDIALIKIDDHSELPVAALGDSDSLEIGEWVMAIGNPFGLGGTVTAGIVSQKGRVIGAGPYDNFIQTDASINPGNSGGPLFNTRGEVVGINTAIVAGGQGIGFAIPINMVTEVLTQLKESGKVTRGWIGVSIQALTPELARSFGLKEASGVLISAVTPGDPADKAGLKPGDIIVSFNGKAIVELSELTRAVASTHPGTRAEVVVIRDGRKKTLFLKVGTRADDRLASAGSDEGRDAGVGSRLGITVQTITPDLAGRLGLADGEGVVISSVKPGSVAASVHLRRGDVIKRMDGRAIRSMDDYNKAMKSAEKKGILRLLVKRGANTMYVALKFK